MHSSRKRQAVWTLVTLAVSAVGLCACELVSGVDDLAASGFPMGGGASTDGSSDDADTGVDGGPLSDSPGSNAAGDR